MVFSRAVSDKKDFPDSGSVPHHHIPETGGGYVHTSPYHIPDPRLPLSDNPRPETHYNNVDGSATHDAVQVPVRLTVPAEKLNHYFP